MTDKLINDLREPVLYIIGILVSCACVGGGYGYDNEILPRFINHKFVIFIVVVDMVVTFLNSEIKNNCRLAKQVYLTYVLCSL